ncbi:MAG: hypothetical protein HC822_02745 [Oscillochloris sp.]|nr:hypothetical protein [Oscillochloris sp.]
MAKAAIIYVGTQNGLLTFSNPGAAKNWRRIGHTLEGTAIRAILAADALHLTVITDTGAQRTEDGAQTWGRAEPGDGERLQTLLDNGEPLLATAQGLARWPGDHAPAPGTRALAMLSGKQEVLLAAIAGGTTLLRSEDGGAHWAPGELNAELQGSVSVIMPSSYHIDTAWAGTDAGELLCSDDRGRSWAVVGSADAPILSLAILRLI